MPNHDPLFLIGSLLPGHSRPECADRYYKHYAISLPSIVSCRCWIGLSLPRRPVVRPVFTVRSELSSYLTTGQAQNCLGQTCCTLRQSDPAHAAKYFSNSGDVLMAANSVSAVSFYFLSSIVFSRAFRGPGHTSRAGTGQVS